MMSIAFTIIIWFQISTKSQAEVSQYLIMDAESIEKAYKTVYTRHRIIVVQKIQGDGTCLLSALAYQIYGENVTHREHKSLQEKHKEKR